MVQRSALLGRPRTSKCVTACCATFVFPYEYLSAGIMWYVYITCFTVYTVHAKSNVRTHCMSRSQLNEQNMQQEGYILGMFQPWRGLCFLVWCWSSWGVVGHNSCPQSVKCGSFDEPVSHSTSASSPLRCHWSSRLWNCQRRWGEILHQQSILQLVILIFLSPTEDPSRQSISPL